MKNIVMRRRKGILHSLILLTFGLFMSMVPAAIQAQSKWTLEFRPSLNFPTTYLADSKLNIGFGFDGQVLYRFMPHTSVYAGWGWNMFPQNKSQGNEFSNEETGYTFGLQFMRAFPNTEIRYFLKGGGVYNHLEIEKGNELYTDSGHELGWQIETGVSLPLDLGIAINPSIRYRQLSGTIIKDAHRQAFDLNYLSVGVGVSKTFR